MVCISSISYSFQFNGQRFGYLNPSLGLRQGDPLSPYLFLLCEEGLSSLLCQYEQSGRLQGLKYGLRGPIISHLLFADDSLLFLEANTTTCAALKEALNIYEAASGQAVNLSKSAVCFKPKLMEDEAASMVAILGVPRVRCHEKYLGLPCREILSKAVIQAIPSYAMNLFKLPFSLIRELHRLCAQFWWGGNSEKKRMHWCTWEKLCVHKADGGMGFRDLRSFNRAILAKQAWRIHSSPTSLVFSVLQGFYFQNILWGRGLYTQGIRRKIGSGEDTLIYHDGWLPRDGVFKISSPRVLGNFENVSSLIIASGAWDSNLIRTFFHPDEAEAILSLPLPRRKVPDSLLWHYDKSGHYTVRSGYWLASNNKGIPSSSTTSHTSWWQKFWRLRIPSKIRVFCDSFMSFKLPSQCDFKEFLLTANDCLSLENLEFLCVLLWIIWFRRNKWIHEQTWLDDESCYSWAIQHLEEFLDANFRNKALPKKRVNTPWQAPPLGWVKINSDAAWCSTKKKFGLGTTIRDSTGKVLGSAAMPIYSSVSVAVAESWALEKGASLAKQLGFSAVILKSDCLAVTKALDLKSVLASEINYVFDSIYELCSNF
ncbi:hypothetical protein UlMin_005154 [Ulmus minor]